MAPTLFPRLTQRNSCEPGQVWLCDKCSFDARPRGHPGSREAVEELPDRRARPRRPGVASVVFAEVHRVALIAADM